MKRPGQSQSVKAPRRTGRFCGEGLLGSPPVLSQYVPEKHHIQVLGSCSQQMSRLQSAQTCDGSDLGKGDLVIQVNSDSHSHTQNMFRFAAGRMDSLPATLKSQESEMCKSRMCSGSGPAGRGRVCGLRRGFHKDSDETGARRHQESLGRLQGSEKGSQG